MVQFQHDHAADRERESTKVIDVHARYDYVGPGLGLRQKCLNRPRDVLQHRRLPSSNL
jgi:hypothetical protein